MKITQEELKSRIAAFVNEGPGRSRTASDIFDRFELDLEIFDNDDSSRSKIHLAIGHLISFPPIVLKVGDGAEARNPIYTATNVLADPNALK